MSSFLSKLSIVGAAVACLAGVPAQAQVTYATDGTTANIPGLTGFATTGADMTGLNVTATFSNGFSQSLAWGTTGAGAGGVFGTGWALTLSGDSFGGNWLFDFKGIEAQLTRLVLDGSTGLTVLDRSLPSPGTDGSANGLDFSFAGGTCGSCAATATYGGLTSIGAAAAVGDLFQKVTVDFTGGTGPRTDWSFVQDTDNDSRFVPGVPEPETYALLLGGLGFVSWVARRRRQVV
ncbi:MAG TPA: PEP-CTERM sorting domain-containing protein [Caldimonas sp.]